MHNILPYGGPVAAYAQWDGLFTEGELDQLEAMASAANVEPTVGDANGQRTDTSVRRSQVRWLFENEAPWVFERLAEAAARMNHDFWRLDLTGFGEALQLTRYDAEREGTYGWHQDFGAKVSRKLSLVVQLTDPGTYTGGDLEVLSSNVPEAIQRVRGKVVAFPAWQLHRVTPVTEGVRHSLVAWASGPAFR